MADFYSQLSANKFESYLFIFAFMVFLFVLVGIITFITGFGFFFIPIAIILAIVLTVGSYYYSDKAVIAISGAKPVEPNTPVFKYLDNTVEGLALAAGIPKPKFYYIEDTAPNAFATGRDPQHAVICVTTGLVQKLDRNELEGVLAHEMSHIRNYDIRLMMVVAVMVGIAVLLSDLLLRMFLFGGIRGGGGGSGEGKGGLIIIVMIAVGILLAILTPIIAQLINFAISRKREYLADASSVQLTRDPNGLAEALRKLENDKEILEAANKATAHLYIVNPLKGQKLWMKSLFSTHPPIEERIRRLEEMGAGRA
jgi:heat shock protein HtpX